MTILLFNFINILCPFFLAEGGGEDEEGVGMVYFWKVKGREVIEKMGGMIYKGKG